MIPVPASTRVWLAAGVTDTVGASTASSPASVTDGRDKVAMASRLDAEDGEAGLGIVEGHPFDQARNDFARTIAM